MYLLSTWDARSQRHTHSLRARTPLIQIGDRPVFISSSRETKRGETDAPSSKLRLRHWGERAGIGLPFDLGCALLLGERHHTAKENARKSSLGGGGGRPFGGLRQV